MIIETKRLLLVALDEKRLGMWINDVSSLEKDLLCTYRAEPLKGIFLDIVKGQYNATVNDPENYVWHSFFWIIRRSDRTVVGSADFKNVPDEKGETEIGYGLGEKFEHNGYMTEAVEAMCRWAFSIQSVKKVIAETETDSNASQRVLMRCGFEKYSVSDTMWWKRER